jgi:hypothetical protein
MGIGSQIFSGQPILPGIGNYKMFKFHTGPMALFCVKEHGCSVKMPNSLHLPLRLQGVDRN